MLDSEKKWLLQIRRAEDEQSRLKEIWVEGFGWFCAMNVVGSYSVTLSIALIVSIRPPPAEGAIELETTIFHERGRASRRDKLKLHICSKY